MNYSVDLILFVDLFVNEAEVLVHKLEHVASNVIELVYANLGIEDCLEPEEGKNEIVEDQVVWNGFGRLLSMAASRCGAARAHEGVARGS